MFWMQLLLFGSAYRANVSASAAGNTDIRIDLILGIAFGDCFDRAAGCAGTTGNASIGDMVCHLSTSCNPR